MNMEVSRRQLIVGAGAGVAGTTLGALGFGDIETVYATSIRAWKLLGTTETLCSQTASFARRPVRPRCATRCACPHRYWLPELGMVAAQIAAARIAGRNDLSHGLLVWIDPQYPVGQFQQTATSGL